MILISYHFTVYCVYKNCNSIMWQSQVENEQGVIGIQTAITKDCQ